MSGSAVRVLNDLNLQMDDGKITVILGKSGCGKTTFLRIVSGLEKADGGDIKFREDVKIGMVFQEPRLMPWLTVWKNITFGMKKKEIDAKRIRQLVEMTSLAGFEGAYPSQLSGGMQQRAALARALAYDPSLILMDEPFAALDYFTRKTMQEELLRIHKVNEMGVIFVTHSIDEALMLGQKLVIFENGKNKKEYDLSSMAFPRDLLDGDMIKIKRDIVKNIGG